MAALIILLIIVVVSILIIRIATVALTLTGLAHDAALFQTLSAFMGVGFTTTESERIVQHPARRRIIFGVMILGNAGLVTAITSLLLTFVGTGSQEQFNRLLWLAIGLMAITALVLSHKLDRFITSLIEKVLERWSDVHVHDYASLLSLSAGYRVGEFKIKPDTWLTGKTLRQANLSDEGFLILGIHRDGDYKGIPPASTQLQAGDQITIYGEADAIDRLQKRLAGDQGDQEHDHEIARRGKNP